MEKIFKINENVDNYSPNYLATICKVGEVFPIDGADKLVKTVINGYDIVISKDTAPDSIVIYFPVETSICEKFLSANNLYEKGEFEMNSNAEEVKNLIIEAENAESQEARTELMNKIKSMCGYFNRHGRVRILKLRGQYSMGFIVGTEAMVNYDPTLADVDWESLVGTQFNFVRDDEFCKKYVPANKKSNEPHASGDKRWKKRMKKLHQFDRLVDGQFAFHYDTKQLGEHIYELSPDDNVSITVKLHGTSAIISNILCRKKLNLWNRIKKFFGRKVEEYEYGNIYSSRNTIKNRYINEGVVDFYGCDIWGCVNRDFGPYLDKGMTVYGEIVGYVEGKDTMIQAQHDYGCKKGQWKFMPYRITMTDSEGNKTEWDIDAVDKWTRDLVAAHPELEEKTMFLTILYYGRLGDLYPDLDPTTHWNENLLARMKEDKDNFGMELDEPLCKNKVPREGVVLRIIGDKYSRAWKLKTLRHYGKEAEQHDKGIADIEETA
jgi:hypothetical protein